jgi:hypothetical protein
MYCVAGRHMLKFDPDRGAQIKKEGVPIFGTPSYAVRKKIIYGLYTTLTDATLPSVDSNLPI